MLDLKMLQKDAAVVEKALRARNSHLDIREFEELDARRRDALSHVEAMKARRNKASAQVAAMKREGMDATALMEEMRALSDEIKKADETAQAARAAVEAWVMGVPNIPDASVPVGPDESANVEVSRWGAPREFSFAPKEHWELGAALGGLDFERAAKLAGSRFVVSWDWAARLERAVAAWFLDVHTRENGLLEVAPPLLVNRATMTGTGQLPKFEEDLFKVQGEEYFLIPTAEVPLTNLHAGEILPEEMLPIGYVAQTPCFRSEAGSYGKDTKGLVRLHQFLKVEMVHFARPEESFAVLERMRERAGALLERLELPYRVVTLCTGDMGFSACKTYDLEVWLPGQNKYREISSCSNCGDFQARRAGIRYRPAGGGKPEFVHTLNGSGLAVGRTVVAILENYQNEDGSVTIPKVLRPYMGGEGRIEAGRRHL